MASEEDKKPKRWHMPEYLEAAGPGVITGAADDDPSGIGTYTMAGAKFGGAFLWAALFTWPLMAGVQMACARVGMVTGHGLASAFAKKAPRWLVVLFALLLFAANTLNVAADLAAMGDATKILTGAPVALCVVLFAALITAATIFLRYSQIAKVLKWLALVLFAYVVCAFVQKPDWGKVLSTSLIPHVPGGSEGWGILTAILGTTISPYLFFWQTSQEVEEEKQHGRTTKLHRRGATSRELFLRRIDVGVGTLFSNLVMFFVILTASLTLHQHGLTNVESSSQAAAALEPLAGKFATLLYTIGLVGTGLLAIPTLTGSSAYALADSFGWRQGLDEKWKRARAFYAVILISAILGVLLDSVGFNPLKALYWSAVVNGALAPFLLVLLFMVARDKKLMRDQPCPPFTLGLVALAAGLMFATLGMMFLV
jgi:NRAMP (natural resistance-associated macrophage protein)-like metal ion transporter